MASTNGKCPLCGAPQAVNTSQRAAICTVCHQPFVVQDAFGGQAQEYLRKGKAYLRVGATHEAGRCFTEAIALAPDDDEAKIFYYGFKYFDAEDYMRRHPVMEPYETEFLTLRTDPDIRREYFMRFFDGSVYKENPHCSYKSKLVSRKNHVVDPQRCDAFCRITGGLPNITIFAEDAPGGMRSPAQVEYLFSKDTSKRYKSQFYHKRYFAAESRTTFVPRKTLFGYKEDRIRKSYPKVEVSQYDIIAGTHDLRERAKEGFYNDDIPASFRVAPNPEIARLIRKYYPR